MKQVVGILVAQVLAVLLAAANMPAVLVRLVVQVALAAPAL